MVGIFDFVALIFRTIFDTVVEALLKSVSMIFYVEGPVSHVSRPFVFHSGRLRVFFLDESLLDFWRTLNELTLLDFLRTRRVTEIRLG